MTPRSDITQLLHQMGEGDATAMDRLMPLVYDELRTIAQRYLRPGGATMTLDTTALVHEAYVRLVGQTSSDFEGRSHFLAVCSVIMRNLVVDFARKRKSAKRGGDAKRVTLDDHLLQVDSQAEEVLALDTALDRLEEYDPKLARVVECRYFAGLTEPETALALGISERSVRRYWTKAKALLRQFLNPENP